MLIVVGSNSPVKIEATRQAFREYFNEINVTSVAVSTGVNPFPWCEDEIL